MRHLVEEHQLRAAEAGERAQQGRRLREQGVLLDAAALQRLADELAVVERIVVAGPPADQAFHAGLRPFQL